MKVTRIVALSAAVCLLAALFSITVRADSEKLETGVSVEGFRIYDPSPAALEYAELLSGELPYGMDFSYSTDGIYLSGTPTAAGTYVSWFYIEASSGTLPDNRISISVTVSNPIPQVVITKSPSQETVIEGDEALFISSAENYSTYDWMVVSMDGTCEYCNEEEITKQFAGVEYGTYRGEDNREYMYLKNIPLSMNGYYIRTRFWNLDYTESVTTEPYSCQLTVVVNPGASSDPAPTPAPIFAPTQGEEAETIGQNQPAVKDTVIAAVDNPMVDGASSTPTPEELERTGNIIVLAAGAAVLLAMLLAVCSYLIKKKRKN